MPEAWRGAPVAGKVKTWVWVVVGIAVFCVLALVAVVGGAFFYMSRHIETKAATPASAAREFEAVRSGFAGQRPLIELDRNGRFLRANTDRPAPPNAPVPDQLRILAFDPSDGRMVQVNVPFWLLRMKAGNATIDLNGSRMDLEDLRLTIHDLERQGPALIIDHQEPDGDRVLVWSR
jgi:hypothetical protein